MQIEEVYWDCSKLIETVKVNAVEVQEIWDEGDEILESMVAVWGILPKGMTKLKKRVLKGNMANITKSGKHYKPSFLEKDHLGRNMGEGSKLMKPNGREEKEEEDRGLTQLKKTQVHVSIWGLSMASHKYRSALLDALNGKEVPIETTPQEVLSLMGVEAPPHLSLTFFDKELPLEGATYTSPLQITIKCMGAKVPMVLIDNGFILNVCPFRTVLTIGLNKEIIIPSPLIVGHMTIL